MNIHFSHALHQPATPPAIRRSSLTALNLPIADEVRFSSSHSFSTRYMQAEAFAQNLHAKQVRKSILSNQPPVPYFTHLTGVADIVRQHGGTEDEQIAALLHDSVEDQAKHYPGGAAGLRQTIQVLFGDRVLAIVNGCTDADTFPKPDWDTRKTTYIDHVKTIYTHEPQYADSILLVSASDKLHNAQSIINDMDNAQIGPSKVFTIFNGGKRGQLEGTLWYYRSLVDAYQSLGAFGQTPLVQTLDQTVSDIEKRGRQAVTMP